MKGRSSSTIEQPAGLHPYESSVWNVDRGGPRRRRSDCQLLHRRPGTCPGWRLASTSIVPSRNVRSLLNRCRWTCWNAGRCLDDDDGDGNSARRRTMSTIRFSDIRRRTGTEPAVSVVVIMVVVDGLTKRRVGPLPSCWPRQVISPEHHIDVWRTKI